MNSYLACFDITDNKIRYRVSKILGSHGTRVQKSVFEVSFKTKAQLQRTQRKIETMLEADDDCRFYRLCANCRKLSLNTSGEKVAIFPSAYIL